MSNVITKTAGFWLTTLILSLALAAAPMPSYAGGMIDIMPVFERIAALVDKPAAGFSKTSQAVNKAYQKGQSQIAQAAKEAKGDGDLAKLKDLEENLKNTAEKAQADLFKEFFITRTFQGETIAIARTQGEPCDEAAFDKHSVGAADYSKECNWPKADMS